MKMILEEIRTTHSEIDDNGIFSIDNGEQRMGVLEYKRVSEQVISVHRTKVESEFGGQGVAKKLFDALIEWAEENDQKIEASCSFVVKMFERNPALAEKFRA